MQTASEKHTVFYDRLSLVERRRANGKLEKVGGDEGGVKVRIQSNNATPILTLHLMSTLVASATITKFDIVSISDDGYCIHLYLDEYSIHKVRRLYTLHFSNDEIATKKFFDSYVAVLPPDTQRHCPSFFDFLSADEIKQVEKNVVENDVSYDEMDGCGGDNEDTKKFELGSKNSDELNLDEGVFQESQDVYAENCLITMPKKW